MHIKRAPALGGGVAQVKGVRGSLCILRKTGKVHAIEHTLFSNKSESAQVKVHTNDIVAVQQSQLNQVLTQSAQKARRFGGTVQIFVLRWRGGAVAGPSTGMPEA